MRIPGNFDRWMFNYKEGNLSPEEVSYFEAFMLNNPDYSADVDAWDNAYVRQSNVEYPNASSLIKEKTVFNDWRNWAAVIILLISVGSGLWFGNNLIDNKNRTQSVNSSTISFESFLSPLTKPSIYQKAIIEERKILAQKQMAQQTTATSDLPTQLNGSVVPAGSIITGITASQSTVQTPIDVTDPAEVYLEESASMYNDVYALKSLNASHYSQTKNLALEANKVRGGNSIHSGKHFYNPTFDISPLDLSFNKRKTGAFAFYLKRILRKLDKIAGYPIALVNLRDPELIVPNRNILNLNPGFTGSAGNFRIGADYRNQWTGELVNSQMATMYFDTYSRSARGGIGGSVTYGDYNNGVYRNMLANLYYSPKFALGKHVVFEPALKVTMGRLGSSGKNIAADRIELERGNLITRGPEDETFSNNSWFKDYGLGFVINTDWFYVGGFVDNLAGHDQRIYSPSANEIMESPKLITGVLGFDYQSRNRRTVLSPFLTYYQYGTKKEIWAGASAQFNWLMIGASYSSNSEYAASVGLKFKSFKLTYQVDMLESEFLNESFVSHNIGIRFNTKNKTIR